FLILNAYVVDRDQHSFPTRRSSDLVLRSAAARTEPANAQADEIDLADTKPARGAERGAERRATVRYAVDLTASLVPFHQNMRGRDRKSTRLNSSHSQISYAVFSLTK